MLRRNRQPRRRPKRARSRRTQLQQLETRCLLAANPLGATPVDNAEFLLGTVAVTPVFFESHEVAGETQNWDPEEIDQVLAKIEEGVTWWSDLLDSLDTVHSLDFVIDDTFARNPVESRYEPINNDSSVFIEYTGDFLRDQGFGEAQGINTIEEAVYGFNAQQREKLQTDWSFTIFVADASDDPDGLFASGGRFAGAFAYPGGLFMVVPSTRPASTFTHEMGHIFWARDEYRGGGSWTDQRGYYNSQNLNAYDNPTAGFVQDISIMRGGVPLNDAYQALYSPDSTLAMVGWRDSDGDGIFDVADVPLDLDAVGYFDADTSQYHFSGTASAVPLLNQNSWGAQSDITLNRISQLQYRLDGGPWQVALEPDQQVVDFDISLSIEQPFSTIEWRAIDLGVGVVSPILAGTATMPAQTSSNVAGVTFVDQNDNGLWDLGEEAITLANVTVRHADGSPLLISAVDAADFADGPLPSNLDGVELYTDGDDAGGRAASFVSSAAGDQRVFHTYDLKRNKWSERWSDTLVFNAEFDATVGEVWLDAVGLESASFARLEAYDANGVLLGRYTSEALGNGESTTLHITDSQGRIARIRALGHAGTTVALNNLRFGFEDSVATDASGGWRLQNLPDGDYQVEIEPARLIHQFSSPVIAVEVVNGTSELIVAAAERVDSPRHNSALAADANGDGKVSANDALVIINDLGRHQARTLQENDPAIFNVDVSNDGNVSALDALLVINTLARQNSPIGEAEGIGFSQSPVQSANYAGGADGEERDGQRDLSTAPSTAELANPEPAKNPQNTVLFDAQGLVSTPQQPLDSTEKEESITSITSEISEPFFRFVI